MIIDAYYFYQSEDLMKEESRECRIDLDNGKITGINQSDAPEWMYYEFVWVDFDSFGIDTRCADFEIEWKDGLCWIDWWELDILKGFFDMN